MFRPASLGIKKTTRNWFATSSITCKHRSTTNTGILSWMEGRALNTPLTLSTRSGLTPIKWKLKQKRLGWLLDKPSDLPSPWPRVWSCRFGPVVCTAPWLARISRGDPSVARTLQNLQTSTDNILELLWDVQEAGCRPKPLLCLLKKKEDQREDDEWGNFEACLTLACLVDKNLHSISWGPLGWETRFQCH